MCRGEGESPLRPCCLSTGRERPCFAVNSRKVVFSTVWERTRAWKPAARLWTGPVSSIKPDETRSVGDTLGVDATSNSPVTSRSLTVLHLSSCYRTPSTEGFSRRMSTTTSQLLLFQNKMNSLVDEALLISSGMSVTISNPLISNHIKENKSTAAPKKHVWLQERNVVRVYSLVLSWKSAW